MRLTKAPQCPRCDSGKKPRVIIDFDDNPISVDQRHCGSCWGHLTNLLDTFHFDDSRMINALKALVSKEHGDGGKTVGEFEITDWGLLKPGAEDYRVVLEAKSAAGYKVEIQACKQLVPLSSRKPDIADEQKVLRRATMPHVLVQAVDALNYQGFRGRHRSRDNEQHWVYLDLEPNRPARFVWRVKMTWPVHTG